MWPQIQTTIPLLRRNSTLSTCQRRPNSCPTSWRHKRPLRSCSRSWRAWSCRRRRACPSRRPTCLARWCRRVLRCLHFPLRFPLLVARRPPIRTLHSNSSLQWRDSASLPNKCNSKRWRYRRICRSSGRTTAAETLRRCTKTTTTTARRARRRASRPKRRSTWPSPSRRTRRARRLRGRHSCRRVWTAVPTTCRRRSLSSGAAATRRCRRRRCQWSHRPCPCPTRRRPRRPSFRRKTITSTLIMRYKWASEARTHPNSAKWPEWTTTRTRSTPSDRCFCPIWPNWRPLRPSRRPRWPHSSRDIGRANSSSRTRPTPRRSSRVRVSLLWNCSRCIR